MKNRGGSWMLISRYNSRTMTQKPALILRGKPLIPANGPFLFGILNVTPDSFSDGGAFLHATSAVAAGRQMLEDGVDVIDVGGESTRPGSEVVSPEEQIRRVVPVIRELNQPCHAAGCAISIDTRSAQVAEAAIDAGASIVNDVSAMRDDSGMTHLISHRQAGVVLMHMKGTPADMQRNPQYADVVTEVKDYLAERIAVAINAGIPRERIIADPGIGFGKTPDHNLELLQRIDEFAELGVPILVGPSRKRFIGQILGIEDPKQRLNGTLAAVAACVLSGVDCIRVHDVKPCREVADLAAAIHRANKIR